ncbi:hypothetical protein QWY82_18875 [Simiduia curdlanivorans]|uniref:Uncharacterized protein n=1 Tax=Simiduia curdlanivorans TaxID=1492769 RepID=A0ABV8V3U7_9GAMM|nr:hypothetical protein [Simiduia curdlanivorans]MDN3640871.1 hypothetical protein [Simiduia curdlanivorans]
MSLFSKMLGIVFIFMFISCVLYVLFGQITVRRLRKNPKTKDALGVEYASGWDIINVAQALAFPRSWSKKLESSPLSFMHANATLLLENTNTFDRFLGSLFYWLLMLSGLSGALLVLLNSMGVFPE